MKTLIIWGLLIFGINACSQELEQGESISFLEIGESGIQSRVLNQVEPVDGCLISYDLSFPEFENAIINKASIGGWVSGYLTRATQFKSFKQFEKLRYENIEDSTFINSFDLGYYLLLKLKDGNYLAVLPLVSDDIMSCISVYEGKPRLKVNTYGTDVYSGTVPLFSWAKAEDPYSATHKCWELALASDFCKENIQWRSEKSYPELYKYLGWCTWEAYEGSINEEIVRTSIEEIKQGDVPIRWVIVDDGYLDNRKSKTSNKPQLLSFGVNNKFPNGWLPITSLKEEATVKWIGIWRNMSGGMVGVSPEHNMPELANHLMLKKVMRQTAPGREIAWDSTLIIRPDEESSLKFYRQMADNTINGGFDFMKVDFQTFNFWMYSGTGNAVNSAHQNNQALEKICKENNLPLLNCISQSNVNVFNTRHSIISRASVDIKLNSDNMGRTTQSFQNNMWWGDILIGDLDMYHTGNKKTAQYLTVARAVSGGPVYISDEPGHFDKEVIAPLIFNNGKVIRTLAPAVPLEESLFIDAYGSGLPYRVIAPTRHKSCVIAAFNFSKDSLVNGVISKNDYKYAAAKEQPFNGLWTLPEEGLVIYDCMNGKGALLNQDYEFSVVRMKGILFNIAPIQKGWAVIGRADKYTGGCTYTIEKISKSMLELTLDEEGPIIVYNTNKQPVTNTGKVKNLGNGFYRIELPVGGLNNNLLLTLSN